jgi:hypothetical protein
MINTILQELSFFRKAFSRERSFQWFVVIVLGFILTQDKLGGVSPLVRALGLQTNAYNSILNFFANSSSFLPQLERAIFDWINLKFQNSIVKINNQIIYIIDGKKISKEGKNMPGNKWQYQDSNSNSKPKYFKGQFFEAIGILVKTKSGFMCFPFAVKMIDGFKLHNRDKSTLKTRSADFISNLLINNSIIVADAWYAAKPFLQAIIESNSTLISRVAKNAVGYLVPDKIQNKRGRPRKYGSLIKLISLFDIETLTSVTLTGIDNTERTIQYWTMNLLWRSAKDLVKFVGCEMNGNRIILLSTNIELSAEEIIQSYIYRTSIETSFWYSTQILFNWCYRFWTKLNFNGLNKFRDCNLHLKTKKEKNKYWKKVNSYESFILIGFFVQAFLVYLIEQKTIIFKQKTFMTWFRSRGNSSISLLSAKYTIISMYYEFINATDIEVEEALFLKNQINKVKNEAENEQISSG